MATVQHFQFISDKFNVVESVVTEIMLTTGRRIVQLLVPNCRSINWDFLFWALLERQKSEQER